MFNYFSGKVSHGFVSIYTSRMIIRIAGSFISLFLPIFLYNLFNGDLKYVIWYYLLGHLTYMFFAGYAARCLNKIGLKCIKPQGAFYAFPSIKKTGLSSLDFANRLLKKQKVAVVPGTAFGPTCEGHIRISYASSYENLKEALRRIEEFVIKK